MNGEEYGAQKTDRQRLSQRHEQLEGEQHVDAVEEDVDGMKSGRAAAAHREIGGVAGQQSRPVHGAFGIYREQAWIGEKMGNLFELTDVGIAHD